jgi:hypothetical protein
MAFNEDLRVKDEEKDCGTDGGGDDDVRVGGSAEQF